MLAIVRKVQALTKVTITKDAKVDKANKEAALRKAKDYLNDQRRSRDKLKKALAAMKDKDGDETKAYDDLKKQFYTQKAIYEQVNKLVSKSGSASQKAALETEKARFSRDLDEEDQEELKEQVAKYLKQMGGKDKAAIKKGRTLLIKLEEDAQFLVAMAKRTKNRRPSDKTKQAYYDAVEKYNFITGITGKNSPAKQAEKIRKVRAAAEKSRDELAALLRRAKTA